MQVDDVMAIGHRFNLTDVVGWRVGTEAGFAYFYIPWKTFLSSQAVHRHLWKSMVSGVSIGDQREMRSGESNRDRSRAGGTTVFGGGGWGPSRDFRLILMARTQINDHVSRP